MSEYLHVTDRARLFDFLAARLAGWHRNTLRQRLRTGCVRVNEETVTRGDHPLSPGDRVLVSARGEIPSAPPRGIETLYQDEHLIAIDKPPGLLSVSTDRQRERTALALVRASLARPGRPARLWPAHRLDRETSGVLLFARSREVCETVRAAWDRATKTYLAVVEGHPRPAAGAIEQPLWEDRALFVHVGRRPGAKQARTRYRTLATPPGRALLELELDTGRRHQIRVHFAWLGHPVLGDARYGHGGPRLWLHARRLVLPHPVHGRGLSIEAPAPGAFARLLAGGA